LPGPSCLILRERSRLRNEYFRLRFSASSWPPPSRSAGGSGAGAFFWSSGHLCEHKAVVVASETQERHAFLVDVGDLEAEHARVESTISRGAAVKADVADLRMRMDCRGRSFELLPVKDRVFRLEERGSGRFDSAIMYTVISQFVERRDCTSSPHEASACLPPARCLARPLSRRPFQPRHLHVPSAIGGAARRGREEERQVCLQHHDGRRRQGARHRVRAKYGVGSSIGAARRRRS